jgi:hypothetical protein
MSAVDGGIGRRAGLKHLWETVPVRLVCTKKTALKEAVFLVLIIIYIRQYRNYRTISCF